MELAYDAAGEKNWEASLECGSDLEVFHCIAKPRKRFSSRSLIAAKAKNDTLVQG